jgi:hypothetical protein
MPWQERVTENISWGDSLSQSMALPTRLEWEGNRSHRFRDHHLEIDSYDFVPVILRHVEQKLIPGDARTGHNDRWWARKAGL